MNESVSNLLSGWILYFALLMFLTAWIITQLLLVSFVLHLATGQIFGLVLWFGLGLGLGLGLGRNWWLGFFLGSCWSIWFVEDCSGFSSMSKRCLLNSDSWGADRGGVLHLSSNSRVVAVTGTTEATHTLSWRFGAVHWNKEKTWLYTWWMDGLIHSNNQPVCLTEKFLKWRAKVQTLCQSLPFWNVLGCL